MPQLVRQLGGRSALAVLVSMIIGSGIFRVPRAVAAETGSVGAIALCWIVGGIIALCGVVTVAELASMFPRAGGMYVYLRESYGNVLAFLLEYAPRSLGGFGVALVGVLFTYDGWAQFSSLAGEVRDPARTLPRVLVGGMLLMIVVYLVVNAAYLYVLPIADMVASPMVATDALRRAVGPAAGSVVSALVMLSTFGALNLLMMAEPRLFYAMAEDGLFFRALSAVHSRNHTPHRGSSRSARYWIRIACPTRTDSRVKRGSERSGSSVGSARAARCGHFQLLRSSQANALSGSPSATCARAMLNPSQGSVFARFRNRSASALRPARACT
jgi:amino acid transporter